MFNLVPFERRQQNELRHMFDDFERNLFGPSNNFAGFQTDIVDKGESYLLKADLPGFSKGDIAVDIDGDRLTIRAGRNEEHEEKKDNFVRRERSSGVIS
ncbi:MAG: Hsp20 family protein, partial [Acetanaerobacterium sp.]